ncbi:MAG: hypothetical protein KGI08_04955 [Thaumarchaeota archaeon]|nr:hypothetical protein [Nitrososphaerota archaeon]MDE1867044.1 hypothetical protein [Nitrososphaerota archaeon]
MNGDFNWKIFEENIIMIGAPGTGKTKKAQEILTYDIDPSTPVWVEDYSDKFGNYGYVVKTVEDLKYGGRYIFQGKDKTVESYKKFCEKLGQQWNIVAIHDEIHQFNTKQSLILEQRNLIQSRRNQGVCNIFISTDTSSIPNYVIKGCTHAFVFRLNLPDDVKWVAKWAGAKAWQLLPKDKRQYDRIGRQFINEPEVSEHGYLYRNMKESESYIFGVKDGNNQTP